MKVRNDRETRIVFGREYPYGQIVDVPLGSMEPQRYDTLKALFTVVEPDPSDSGEETVPEPTAVCGRCGAPAGTCTCQVQKEEPVDDGTGFDTLQETTSTAEDIVYEDPVPVEEEPEPEVRPRTRGRRK